MPKHIAVNQRLGTKFKCLQNVSYYSGGVTGLGQARDLCSELHSAFGSVKPLDIFKEIYTSRVCCNKKKIFYTKT